MKWIRLRNNQCPQCGKVMKDEAFAGIISCSICDFKISEKKMSKIVSDYNRQIAEERKNNKIKD